MDIDRIDEQILRALRNDARISNKALAERLNIAPSTCLTRVRRLTALGVITGYHAHLKPALLGFGLQALIAVRLKRHARPQVEAFRNHALALPEAVQCFHVAGQNDFLVHVWVRDAEHLRELAMNAFTARDEVAQIETGLIFEHAINTTLPAIERQDQGAHSA